METEVYSNLEALLEDIRIGRKQDVVLDFVSNEVKEYGRYMLSKEEFELIDSRWVLKEVGNGVCKIISYEAHCQEYLDSKKK